MTLAWSVAFASSVGTTLAATNKEGFFLLLLDSLQKSTFNLKHRYSVSSRNLEDVLSPIKVQACLERVKE